MGGVEVVVGHLADELHRRQHHVTVYAQKRRGATFPIQHDYPVRRFDDWTGTHRFPVAPGLGRALWHERKEIDVIHAHSFHAAPAIMAATVPQVPLVFTPHFHAVGHTAAASLLHLFYDPLATLLFRRASRITCVSVAESELLVERYPFVEARVSVVSLGVDTRAIAAAEPFEVERPVILAAGRLETYKRIDLAVRALAVMRTDAQLVVCGGGPAQPGLERLAGELGLEDRVQFPGTVSSEDLQRWQRTATSAVSLSEREAFGLVLLEAMVAGSRAVASNIPAHVELARRLESTDRDIALLAPDVTAVAAELDRQMEMGRMEPAPDPRLDWSAVGERFETIYRAVSSA